jgi:hypothetical protein
MPIQKFRSIEEMSAAPHVDRGVPLGRRIAELLAVSAALAPQVSRGRGVFKFRSFEEMHENRLIWERKRVEAGRSRVLPGTTG